MPVPTENSIRPLLPCVAAPVTNLILPEDPDEAVPDVKLKCPLTPFVPASGVFKTIEPLDLSFPAPVARLIEPPV